MGEHIESPGLYLVPRCCGRARRTAGAGLHLRRVAGQANRDDDGTFRDCTMTADYANGITLAFIISRDFGWGLVLANEKWNLQVGVEEPVTLSIDKLAPIAGTAKVVDAHGILVPLDNADPVVEAMRGGHTLAVVTPSRRRELRAFRHARRHRRAVRDA